MTADQLIALLHGVRAAGKDRWRALCPAHEDRTPSLSIVQKLDKLLIYCFSGCRAIDIVNALGLTLADLFTTTHWRRPNPDPFLQRKRRALDQLEAWRQQQMRIDAEELRLRDQIIHQIDHCLIRGVITIDEAWTSLEYELEGYNAIEHRFDELVRGENVLELWRESRRAA
jgi:hypothetical protein